MSGSVKRYRMVSPERYASLISSTANNNDQTTENNRPPPTVTPEQSDPKEAYRILEFLPLGYRKNSELILNYLAQLDDSIFQVMPGTLELIINNGVISGSNLLDILKGFHLNLPTSKKPEGLWTLLYLLAKATPASVGLFQSPKIRTRFEEMKQGKFDHANFIK